MHPKKWINDHKLLWARIYYLFFKYLFSQCTLPGLYGDVCSSGCTQSLTQNKMYGFDSKTLRSFFL